MMPYITYSIFEESYVNELYSDLKNLYESFVLKGHYVVVVEMGVTNKNNTEERVKWGKFFVSTARKFNMPCYVWDTEYFRYSDLIGLSFGLYNRKEGK